MRHGLQVVRNKIPVPDLRIEYQTREGDAARINLELVTEHYRGRLVADKVHTGFSLYTPRGEADHLRRVLDQRELTAGDPFPMKISCEHMRAIRSLGYTEDEAKSLYIVANHSGYFVPLQFIAFTGASWGKRSQLFTDKLESRGHVTWREYQDMGGVYDLFSRTLYLQIDRENLRNRRRHSTEFIRTRLLLLDFVLANQAYDYFETENDKVRFFCDELAIQKKALPAKAYEGVSTPEPTLCYFVDKFPLFLAVTSGSSSPVVAFSYVDPGQASIAVFANHLNDYAPLFRHLRRFRFIYIAPFTVHFARAEQCFSSLVKTPLQAGVSDELERYFLLRAAWDGKQCGTLSTEDIEWLDEANKRSGGPHIERLYTVWRSSETRKDEYRALVRESQPARSAEFSTYLVTHARQDKRKELARTT